MAIEVNDKNLGAVTAYAYAKRYGDIDPSMTEAEFGQLLGSYISVAEDAEAFAKGTRNGTAVDSTDPAYHNNSKYYADQAADVMENIPQDYSDLSADVTQLKSDLNETESEVYSITNTTVTGTAESGSYTSIEFSFVKDTRYHIEVTASIASGSSIGIASYGASGYVDDPIATLPQNATSIDFDYVPTNNASYIRFKKNRSDSCVYTVKIYTYDSKVKALETETNDLQDSYDDITEYTKNLFSFANATKVNETGASAVITGETIEVTVSANATYRNVGYDVLDLSQYRNQPLAISMVLVSKTLTGSPQIRAFEAVNGTADTSTRKDLNLTVGVRGIINFTPTKENSHLLLLFTSGSRNDESGKKFTINEIQIEVGQFTDYVPRELSAIDIIGRDRLNQIDFWRGKKVVWLGTSVAFGQKAETSYAYELSKALGFTLVNTAAPGEAIHIDASTGGYPGTAAGVTSLSIAEYAELGVTIPDTPIPIDYTIVNPVDGTDYNDYWRTWEHIFVQDNADADLWVLAVIPNNQDFALTDWEAFDFANWKYSDNSSFASHRTTFLGALLFLLDKIYTLNPKARVCLLCDSDFSIGTRSPEYSPTGSKGLYCCNLVKDQLNYQFIDVWKNTSPNVKTWPVLASVYNSSSDFNHHPSTYAHELMGDMLIGEFLKLR